MTANEIIDRFHQQGISEQTRHLIQTDAKLRHELVSRYRQDPDRAFALALLESLSTDRRRDDDLGSCTSEDLMLACYLLGLARRVEDSLRIWTAKEIDFDTHCMVDVQLVVFMGVEETLSYLNTEGSPAAATACAYIEQCSGAGDFKNLERYYSPDTLPWWIDEVSVE